MPIMPQNPLFAEYKLRCSHPGCRGVKLEQQAMTAGLKVGDKLSDDPSDFSFGRCPHCKRTGMIVVNGPPERAPQLPEGWHKIPEQ